MNQHLTQIQIDLENINALGLNPIPYLDLEYRKLKNKEHNAWLKIRVKHKGLFNSPEYQKSLEAWGFSLFKLRTYEIAKGYVSKEEELQGIFADYKG